VTTVTTHGHLTLGAGDLTHRQPAPYVDLGDLFRLKTARRLHVPPPPPPARGGFVCHSESRYHPTVVCPQFKVPRRPGRFTPGRATASSS
jgi:hypothetical protein